MCVCLSVSTNGIEFPLEQPLFSFLREVEEFLKTERENTHTGLRSKTKNFHGICLEANLAYLLATFLLLLLCISSKIKPNKLISKFAGPIPWVIPTLLFSLWTFLGFNRKHNFGRIFISRAACSNSYLNYSKLL